MGRKVANIYRAAVGPKPQPKSKRKLILLIGGIVVVGFLCFGNLFEDDYDMNISLETMQTKPDFTVDASTGASTGANANANANMNVPAMNMNPQESSFSTPTIGVTENDLDNDTDNVNDNDNDTDDNNGSGSDHDNGNNDNDNGADQDETGAMDENAENDGTENDANDEDTDTDLNGGNDADLAADGVGGADEDADEDGTNIDIDDTNDEAAETDAETQVEAASNEVDTDTDTDTDTTNDTIDIDADADADADADGTPKEEDVVADPHLYIKEEKAETAVEENKSEDAKAVNHMDGDYYDKMKKFQASAGIAVNDTVASGDVVVESNVTISNSSAVGNVAENLVVVDEATNTTTSAVETVVASESETATGAGKANITNVSIANASVSVSTNASVTTTNTPKPTHVITTNYTDVGASETKLQSNDGAQVNDNSTVENDHASGATNHTVESSVKGNASAVEAVDAVPVVENKANATKSELKLSVNLTDTDGNNDQVVNNTDTAIIKVDDVTTNATTATQTVSDDSESETNAVALELCKLNPFAHTLELSLEDIQVEAEKILNKKKEDKIEEVSEGVVREEEAEDKQRSATRHLRGPRSRGLEQVSSGVELVANVSTQDTNATLATVFSVKCKDDESSIMIPGMCGGLIDKDVSKHSDCEYYVAYAGALPDDLASMPIHIKLAKFSECKVNVVSLCGGEVNVKLTTATLLGDRYLDDSIKERIIVHEDTCIESGKRDIVELGVEVSEGIVAKPTPLDTNLLYIDLTGSSISPSEFLGYISGERLRLVNTNDDFGEKGDVYLPKQIVFNGISETLLEEPLQISLLSKGYAILRGVGPLSLIRFLCPKTTSMAGSASFVAAGFPM